MMPTMQEIDYEKDHVETHRTFASVETQFYLRILEAARRGVELHELQMKHEAVSATEGNALRERAEKAEAGMAWLAECVIRERSGTPDPKGWIAQAFEYADDRNEKIANLRAELAALKVEQLTLAKECIDAWENAVDWSSYASEYFQEKYGADTDQDKLDNARDRLAMLEIRARNQGDSNEH